MSFDIQSLLSKYKTYQLDEWGGTDYRGLTGDVLSSSCFSFLCDCLEESTTEDVPLTECLDDLFTDEEFKFLYEALQL